MTGPNHKMMKETARLYAKHNGSVIDAARELGIPRTTFSSRVETAKTYGHIKEIVVGSDNEPDTEIKRIYLKPNYKVFTRPRGEQVNARVLTIGDAHDSPEIPDKSRFRAMGAYAKENKVDYIVQIGDFMSVDSMSSHDPNWTIKGQNKPSFKEDIASFEEALRAFDDGLDGYEVTKHVTLGNHEDRINRFVNNNPEIVEILFEEVYSLLHQFGWDYSPFGEFHFIGDVGFTHAPLNQMGKPYGGMNCQNQIARDSLHDVVFGHTHKRTNNTFPKIGKEHVTVINVGCAMPDGHIEDYAKHSVTGWSYGVYDLDIRGGRIKGHKWVPMDVLLEDYNA